MRIITKNTLPKSLIQILPKVSGRNQSGKITSAHRGGREKRYYRKIDFRRDKINIAGKVISFEYDPNRNVNIALIQYADGEKRYILAPVGIKLNDKIVAGNNVAIKTGNAIPLVYIPIGVTIHNIELHQGRGGQIVRSAGGVAHVLAKEEGFVHVKLPSGEVRRIPQLNYATIGQLGNLEWKTTPVGKAGRMRHRGVRPKVRGTAQHPASHPHGGGEGRSGVGLIQPKTPWGKPARGLKTRKKHKYSDKYIVSRRK